MSNKNKVSIWLGALLILGAFATALLFSLSQAKTSDALEIAGTYVNSDDSFVASVTTNTIEIYVVENATKSLYWKGTWTEGDRVSSQADKEALNSSLMGSGSDYKLFEVDGDKITFDFQMMGSTTKIVLKKVN